jgi:hypothetical protein
MVPHDRPGQKLDVVWSLRMTAHERREASYGAKRFKCGDQRAYRFAAELGFHLLRTIDYGVEELIVAEAVRKAKEKASP